MTAPTIDAVLEAPTRLAPADLLRTAWTGLTSRRLRAGLSALGIAIGIAALVAVMGVSASSRGDLLAELDKLGTNLLTVTPGQDLTGQEVTLPPQADAMVGRIPAVQATAATGTLDASVRRSDKVSEGDTGGITVAAATTDLAATLGIEVAEGRFHDAATSTYPAVVLGAVAAERLGITGVEGSPALYLGGRWFTVVGVLEPAPLAPEIDRSALVGFPVAEQELGADGSLSTIYVRADPDDVENVRGVLAATADPEAPEQVAVGRPSDALEARAAAASAFTSLLLGLGAVALLVGGIGIANVMVIAVLERRREIGLRRAIGATRRHIGLQLFAESLVLSAIGGAGGVAVGVLATLVHAASEGWRPVLSPTSLAAGFIAAVVIGAGAGVYPAIKATRLSPTEALRSA